MRENDESGIFVARSTNGGFTWSRPCVPAGTTDANARCGDFAVSVMDVVTRLAAVRFGAQSIGSLTHLTSPTTPRPEWVRPVAAGSARKGCRSCVVRLGLIGVGTTGLKVDIIAS